MVVMTTPTSTDISVGFRRQYQYLFYGISVINFVLSAVLVFLYALEDDGWFAAAAWRPPRRALSDSALRLIRRPNRCPVLCASRNCKPRSGGGTRLHCHVQLANQRAAVDLGALVPGHVRACG